MKYLCKYPLWSSKFLFKIIFTATLLLTIFTMVFQFIILDIEHRYQVIPENTVLEHVSEHIKQSDFDEYLNKVNQKARVLGDVLETSVTITNSINTSISFAADESTMASRYSIYYSENIQLFLALNNMQTVQITPLSNEDIGIFVSEQVYDDINRADEVLVYDDVFGSNFIRIKILGVFKTQEYKSVLFDAFNDMASSLNQTILAPFDSYQYIAEALDINESFSLNIVYNLGRDIRNTDIGVINSLFSNPIYKTRFIDMVSVFMQPTIDTMLTIIIYTLVVATLLVLFIMGLRYEDLRKIIMINYIYFDSIKNITIKMIVSNIIITLKSVFCSFAIGLFGCLLVFIFTGYFINLFIYISISIGIIMILNFLVGFYYGFRIFRSNISFELNN